MNVDINQHNNMIPSAHGSDHQGHYSLQPTKGIIDSSPSNLALNFTQDLLHQAGHHGHQGVHQRNEDHDHKSNSSANQLDSGSLIQSAVGMNMWKDSMGLNYFKHSAMVDHGSLQNTDINSFSNWHHGNNIGHPSSVSHHILENQHLIGYGHHQRGLPIHGQDLVGGSVKGQSSTEQSFMLNPINHQASTSQNSSSSHQTQPLDNLSLRSHPFDHSASYNLSINDNQFYSGTRSDNRSHQSVIKSSFMVADRSGQLSLAGHHSGQSPYNSSDHSSLIPTTSHQLAGSSSGNHLSASSSKHAGSFICATCNQSFALKNVYQSHLKTHSQDKVSKAKFSCELCGHSFSQKTSLNRHMKSHTGERPFPCEICAKAFSEKERLKIHMRTHTGEKPFSCSICGKSFSQKSTVKRHQTVHTGEKKFRCDCGKGFANRGNLIAHIKTRGANHFE